MLNRFSRTELLIGGDAMKKLEKSHIAVFGIGGVGGYTVEALVRSGVGKIDIVDSDRVSLTNINRQIIADTDTIGKYKTDAFEERIKKINPDCVVTKHQIFFCEDTANEFDFGKYDYIVDAVDTVSAKLLLVEKANENNTPIISSMGAGNKIDPTAFEAADIYKTSVCPLARVMRRELKKRGIKKLKVVYSKEQPIKPLESEEQEASGRRSVPGSTAFVPSVAGLIIASEVIKDICK